MNSQMAVLSCARWASLASPSRRSGRPAGRRRDDKPTPIRRVSRRKVDAQALTLWRAIRDISPVDRAEYEPIGRRREYIDANCQLCSHLGIWWGFVLWPAEVDSPEPPGHLRHNSLQAPVWRRAYRWRCLLMEAEAKVVKRLMSARAEPRHAQACTVAKSVALPLRPRR
jgi:hypothetical protein